MTYNPDDKIRVSTTMENIAVTLKDVFNKLHYRARSAGLSGMKFELLMPVEWRWDVLYYWAQSMFDKDVGGYQSRYELDRALHTDKIYLFNYIIDVSVIHAEQNIMLVMTQCCGGQIINEQRIATDKPYWIMRAPWMCAVISIEPVMFERIEDGSR